MVMVQRVSLTAFALNDGIFHPFHAQNPISLDFFPTNQELHVHIQIMSRS